MKSQDTHEIFTTCLEKILHNICMDQPKIAVYKYVVALLHPVSEIAINSASHEPSWSVGQSVSQSVSQ